MDAVVARLHRKLVEALLARGPEALERPVTVAEIYQDLIPYRTVRSALGVELNADYEHALLRLLAGEGNLVRLEPASAREELRNELDSPDPYVGIYRNFAACDVWISRGPADAEGPPAEQESAPAAQPPAIGPSPRPAAQARPAPQARPAAPAPAPGASAQQPQARKCVFCREPLPQSREVRFCPHCGANQKHVPCGECGEALEQTWRFCIRCGAAVGAPAGTAHAGR